MIQCLLRFFPLIIAFDLIEKRNLFFDRDRLELPVENQIFGNASEAREIIEEYNEEEEQKWREQHKIRMREHKLAEANERKHPPQHDDEIDIDAILEQAELMEELENELEQMNIEDDENLQEYLSETTGKWEKPQEETDDSQQSSHQIQNIENHETNDEDEDEDDDGSDEIESEEFLKLSASANSLSAADKVKFYEIHLMKVREYFEKNQRSLHNFNEFTDKRVTEECLRNAIDELQETLNNNTTETGHKLSNTNQTSEEHSDGKCNASSCIEIDCQNAMEPRKFHTCADFEDIEREYSAQGKSKSELLIFYKSQLRIVMKSIAGCTIDMHAREEKRKLYEFISDRISSLRDEIQKEKQIKLEEDFVDDDDIEKSVKHLDRPFESNGSTFTEIDDLKEDESMPKRKISFASQPITVTFYEDDEPCVVRVYSRLYSRFLSF